jgi:hypothetical protein
MPGSPKKRARRLALEAERNRLKDAGMAAPVSQDVAPAPSPTEPRHHVPKPKVEKPEADDPLVALLAPAREEAARQESDDLVDVGLLSTKEKAFNDLLALSFERALDIMRLGPKHTCEQCGHEQGDENFDRQVLTRQASIIVSMLSTTAKIDEARLKGRGKDRVHDLLEELRKQKSGMN